MEDFSPPPWLFGGHRQTVAGSLTRWAPRLPWRRVHLLSAHGDLLSVDIMASALEGPPRRRLLLLHGLTGNSHSSPLPQIARLASRHGIETWALNFRGADGAEPAIPRLYHAGCSDDLESVVASLPGDRPWRFVGFSLGANVMLKWLGESPERELTDLRTLAVSCPFDLARCAQNLEADTMNRFYRWLLMRNLKRLAHRFLRRHPDVLEHSVVESMRTFYDIDQNLIAPLHGFEGAHDYWHRCSSARFLADIKVPTTILHALDDPFMPYVPEIQNPNLTWLLKPTGGHLGFVDGARKDWLVHHVVRYAAL